MKIEYDKDADAAYVYLKDEIKEGEVAETRAIKDTVNVDMDKEGKIVGIEILNAAKNTHLDKIKEIVNA